MGKKEFAGTERAQAAAAQNGCGLGCAVSPQNIARAAQTLLGRTHCGVCCNLLRAMGCMYCAWDFSADDVVYSDNWDDALGRIGAGGVRAALERPAARFTALERALRRIAAGRYGTARLRARRAAGEPAWYRFAAEPVLDAEGKALGAVASFSDVTREVETFRRLLLRAQRDALTGLYNKQATRRLISAALARGPGALLFLDIDNFKWINDSRGHLAGDFVLRQFGAVLRRMLRPQEIAGRVGGDEFVLFLPGVAERSDLAARAEALIDTTRRCCSAGAPHFPVTVSVGAALCAAGRRDFFALYDRADRALYSAKRRGKNCFVLYGEE